VRDAEAPRGPWARLKAAPLRVERLLAEHGDPSTADVTGRVLYALGALGYQHTEPRIGRALDFLRRHQTREGSWWARWSVNYLTATSYILTGLLSVGAAAEEPMLRRAASWLLSRQNPDGGFGETPDSFVSPALAGRGPSSLQITGVVAWALISAGAGRTPEVARAIRYLLARQGSAGGWDDQACYGVIFPHLHYYYTDTFPTYFALEALHAYHRLA
jgi:squalene-hopene/tetraprenyl-beta-curcumene cyclase